MTSVGCRARRRALITTVAPSLTFCARSLVVEAPKAARGPSGAPLRVRTYVAVPRRDGHEPSNRVGVFDDRCSQCVDFRDQLGRRVSIEQMLRSSRRPFGFDFRQLIHDRYHAGAKIPWRPRRAFCDVASRSPPFSRCRLSRLPHHGNRLEHDGTAGHGERRHADRQIR